MKEVDWNYNEDPPSFCISAGDLLNGYSVVKSVTIKEERKALLQELVDATGYSLGRILSKTKGMQTPADLRFILAAMKNVPKAKDARHAFNMVMYQPNKK